MKVVISIIFLLFCFVQLSAQNVTAFGQRQNYGVSGRLSAGVDYYQHYGEGRDRLPPFGYRLTGALNIKLGAVQVPISLSINQLGNNISSPFNLYGASPYWKWVKLHLGHRSLNFSPFVYSGRAFQGVGVELTPGKFSFTAFHGRMENLYAIRDTLAAGAFVLPSYDRWITGAKIGFGDRNNRVELMTVRIKDEGIEDSLFVDRDPVENWVLGLNGNFRLWKKFFLEGKLATSIFTSNQLASKPGEFSNLEQSIEDAITINISSRLSWAGEVFAGYAFKGRKLGVSYRRVAPYYYSLGTNFIQNDIQNLTLTFGWPFLNRRLRIRGSAGVQSDNLSNQKSYTSQRIIGSVTASYFPGENFNLVLRYSNYQHESQAGLVQVNDTFRILTITHNAYLASRIGVWSTEDHKLNINVNAFRNQVVDEAAIGDRNANFTGWGGSVQLRYQYNPWSLLMGPTFNINRYQFTEFTEGRVGTGFIVQKSFWDQKLRLSTHYQINQNQYQSFSNGWLQSLSGRLQCKVSKSHSLSARIFYIDQKILTADSFREMRLSINYNYVLG